MAYLYCRSLTFHAWQCPFKPATITEKSGYAIEKLERLSTRQLLALGLSTGFYANEKDHSHKILVEVCEKAWRGVVASSRGTETRAAWAAVPRTFTQILCE